MLGMGRLSDYDPAICEKICERIATSELGLEQVLEEIRLTDGYAPATSTIYRWLETHPEFQELSARARKYQAQILHDRAQQVAQNPMIGIVERVEVVGEKIVTTRTTSDNVERSKLLVQTLLKRAGQLDARKYGEKSEISGPNGGPIPIKLDREEIIAKLIGNREATDSVESEK
jgi:hypothetical protein